MTLSPSLDVLIVGAGPVGMTAAAELTRQGLSVRVVERRDGPTTETRAPVLWPRTQEVYAAMGLLPKFQAIAVTFTDMDVYAYRQHLGHYRYDDSDSPYGTPLILTQGLIEGVLRDHLQEIGRPVEYNIEAGNFTQDDRGVGAALTHADGRTEQVRASWLIGADGGRSPVRAALSLDFPTEPYEGFQIRIADGHIRWSHPQGARGYFFIHAGAYLGLQPAAAPSGWTRAGVLLHAHARHRPEQPRDAHRSRVAESDPRSVGRPRRDPLGTPVDQPPPFPARRGRYLSAGPGVSDGRRRQDHHPYRRTGHEHGHPGRLQSGLETRCRPQGGVARTELLDSYDAERLGVAHVVDDFTKSIFQLATRPNPLRTWGMRTLGPLAFRLRAVQQWQAQQQTELNIHYPDSPLTRDHGGRGLKAGRRAPDAMLVRLPSRDTMHLFDLYDGRTWNLLLFSGASPDPATLSTLNDLSARLNTVADASLRTTVIVQSGGMSTPGPAAGLSLADSEGEAHRRYGVSGPRLYLVRPDGYVGFRGGPQDAPDLAAYLDEVFQPGSEARRAALEACSRRCSRRLPERSRAALVAAAGLTLGGAALLAARRTGR